MKIIVLTLVTLAFSSNAQVTGELDATYGIQGLVVEHFVNNSTTNLASAVDSQGRLLVLQARKSGNVYNLFVFRYLTNGAIDNSYTGLASEVDAFLIDGDFSLAVDASDGVFLGYSNYTCVAVNTDCQQDIFIKHYNNTGLLVGSQIITFDLGSTYLRQNDKFADLVYIPDTYGHNTEMLAIAATIDYDNVFDTDFGVVLLNVAFDGSLSLRTTFSGDGKATCAFDQDIGHSGIGVDEAKAIVIEEGSPLEMIIGGSSFEGNGSNNDGWNLAFCKLDVLGSTIQSWSTLPLIDTFNDVEKLEDMYYSSFGVQRLIVAAKFSNGSDNDFNIGRYLMSGNQWVFDNGFGNNGWGSVGFTELFIGDTNDIVKTITIDSDNNITAVGHMLWQDNGIDYSKVALAQFDRFGALKTDWAINGTKVHDFSSNNKTQVNHMSYDINNKEFYLVGDYPNGSVSDAYIANILDKSDSLFLNGFEN